MLKTPTPEMHGPLCTWLHLFDFMREQRSAHHVDTAVACQVRIPFPLVIASQISHLLAHSYLHVKLIWQIFLKIHQAGNAQVLLKAGRISSNIYRGSQNSMPMLRSLLTYASQGLGLFIKGVGFLFCSSRQRSSAISKVPALHCTSMLVSRWQKKVAC